MTKVLRDFFWKSSLLVVFHHVREILQLDFFFSNVGRWKFLARSTASLVVPFLKTNVWENSGKKAVTRIFIPAWRNMRPVCLGTYFPFFFPTLFKFESLENFVKCQVGWTDKFLLVGTYGLLLLRFCPFLFIIVRYIDKVSNCTDLGIYIIKFRSYHQRTTFQRETDYACSWG